MTRILSAAPRRVALIENTIVPAFILGVLLAAFGITFYMLGTQTHTATLMAQHWTHEQQVERFEPRLFTAWDTPADAYNISYGVVFVETRPEGADCTPTRGGYLCQQATYTADRWGYHHALVTSGERGEPMIWPEHHLPTCRLDGAGVPEGCLRAGARIAHYSVDLRLEGGDVTTCAMDDRQTWNALTPGASVQVRVDSFTGSIRCETVRWP